MCLCGWLGRIGLSFWPEELYGGGDILDERDLLVRGQPRCGVAEAASVSILTEVCRLYYIRTVLFRYLFQKSNYIEWYLIERTLRNLCLPRHSILRDKYIDCVDYTVVYHWYGCTSVISLIIPIKMHASSYVQHLKTKAKAARLERAWGERRYSSYSLSTLALDGGEWSSSRSGRTSVPEKGPPVPIVQDYSTVLTLEMA
jgi:hypothetical protein